jgi:putative sterol carrier protein
MVYKQKVQDLLTVLDGKLRIVEGAASGAMKLGDGDIFRIVREMRQVTDRITELVNIERN